MKPIHGSSLNIILISFNTYHFYELAYQQRHCLNPFYFFFASYYFPFQLLSVLFYIVLLKLQQLQLLFQIFPAFVKILILNTFDFHLYSIIKLLLANYS